MENELELYILYLQDIKNASKNTVASYKRDLTRLIDFLKEQNILSFDKWNETCLNSYILYLEKSGLSPSTVSRNISSIKVFVLYLIKQGKLSHDPSERIKPPKIGKRTPGIISIDEINLLLEQPNTNTAKGIRDQAMLELIYATGLRVSELIALRCADVNFQASYIQCINGNKERIIPFGKKAKNALKLYMENARSVFIKDGAENILFSNCQGFPLSRQGFWKLIKRYAKNAGIKEDITPHTLRHSFAAHLVENGADLKAVQEMLGNSELTSAQTYLYNGNNKVRDVYIGAHPRA